MFMNLRIAGLEVDCHLLSLTVLAALVSFLMPRKHFMIAVLL